MEVADENIEFMQRHDKRLAREEGERLLQIESDAHGANQYVTWLQDSQFDYFVYFDKDSNLHVRTNKEPRA